MPKTVSLAWMLWTVIHVLNGQAEGAVDLVAVGSKLQALYLAFPSGARTNLSTPAGGQWGNATLYCKLSWVGCASNVVTNLRFVAVKAPFRMSSLTTALLQLDALVGLTKLDFGTSGANGTLPASWSQLKAMKYLYMRQTKLTGGLPKDWGRLKTLLQLGLNENNFGGVLPPEWRNLTNLEALWLNNNPNLYGSVPSAWGNLTKITKLTVGFTDLCGAVPSVLSSRLSVSAESNYTKTVLTSCLPKEGNVRLNNKGAFGGLTGVVQIYHNGKWGQVCASEALTANFDWYESTYHYYYYQAAREVCKKLGLLRGIPFWASGTDNNLDYFACVNSSAAGFNQGKCDVDCTTSDTLGVTCEAKTCASEGSRCYHRMYYDPDIVQYPCCANTTCGRETVFGEPAYYESNVICCGRNLTCRPCGTPGDAWGCTWGCCAGFKALTENVEPPPQCRCAPLLDPGANCAVDYYGQDACTPPYTCKDNICKLYS